MSKFALSRSINGISLNGQEFALDSNQDIMTFESKHAATSFASLLCTGKHGTIDFEPYGLNVCELFPDGEFAVC